MPIFALLLVGAASAWQPPCGAATAAGLRCASPSLLSTKRKASKSGSGGRAGVSRVKPAGGAAAATWASTPTALGPPGAALINPAYEELTAWLTAEGANLASVAIADFDGLRGVMATRSIAPGEEIVAIPATCAVDLGVQGADPLPAALRMLAQREMDEGSRREVYYSTLPPPDSLDLCTPDFFSEKEMQMLQWPPLIVATRKRGAAVRKALGGTAPSGETPITELAIAGGRMREVRWAVWLIQSRVLTVLGPDSQGKERVSSARPLVVAAPVPSHCLAPPPSTGHKLLIPFIDMFNHRASSPHYLTGRTDGMLRVVAGQPIVAGEQIEIVYGTSETSNEDFLGCYGFVDLAAAPADEALLRAHPEAKPMLLKTSVEEDEALLAAAPPPKEELALRFRLALKRALARSGASVGFGR